jgi:molecular chaperone HtpG
MRDRKFYDRAKDAILLRLVDGSAVTVSEYLDSCKEKHENTVDYASDKQAQVQYISLLENEGIKIALLDRAIDSQFVQMLEAYEPTVSYKRIDSDVANALKTEDTSEENEKLTKLFCEVAGNDKLQVKFQSFKDEKLPAILTVSEESRRMEEMMRLYAMQGRDMPSAFPLEYTLTVNTSCGLIQRLTEYAEVEDSDKAKLIASQIYRLCLLSQRKLNADELNCLLSDSFEILYRL